MKQLYADVILPFAVKGSFTYRVPQEFVKKISRGSRVVVQFGSKRLYSGLAINLTTEPGESGKLKDILEVLDPAPVLSDSHLDLWKWISEYYMCSPGEVMKAAIPSGLFLESETLIRLNPGFNAYSTLDTEAAYIFNIIGNKGAVTLKSLPGVTGTKSTMRIVDELIKKNALIAGESLSEKYSPREEIFVTLSRKYSDRELNEILDSLSKAPKQHDLLVAFLRNSGYSSGSELNPVRRSDLLKDTGALLSSLTALIRKGIMVSVNFEVSRIMISKDMVEPLRILSPVQDEAMASIKEHFRSKDIVLLHGITSSGKTEIYIHLIEEQLAAGNQVLYLLPEIALTGQITQRLQKHFGPGMAVYHSRLNDLQKVEIWRKTMSADKEERIRLVIGVRSSLFLPFQKLGLVIVDEEHDTSYKQHDPSPRYHARDTAIMLAAITGAKTLLGSATPSVESYYNAKQGKYGLARLMKRYGDVKLPGIEIANTREAYTKKLMVSHFTPQLLHAVDDALEKGEQVILFRNRRGFSPYIECSECGWIPLCASCAVRLTYHREVNRLKCHYCGYSGPVPVKCGNCGSVTMVTRGFGTEKLEDEIKIVFPKARVSRLDSDTTRSRTSTSRIIESFEKGQTDILIGTQMVSKGLDFENLTVVGILDADNMLNFPDFRAHERTYQLIAQVSGRAGRRVRPGKVIIQTGDPENRILRLVVNNNYDEMFRQQMEERREFNYPPACRMIKLVIRHRDRKRLNEFSEIIGKDLRQVFGTRVLGPESPLINRIQMWYLSNILIKIEKEKPLNKAKMLIAGIIEKVEGRKGTSSLRISADVDPY